MLNLKNIFQKSKKIPIHILGIVTLFLLAGCLLIFNEFRNRQSSSAIPAQVRFEGQYRIGEGEWQDIVPGKHISSTQGDVTLKGHFHLYFDGEYLGLFDGNAPIALYTNHINIQVKEANNIVELDNENRLYGISSCGVNWDAYEFVHDGTSPIEMIIHNPHMYGNELAVDQLLSNFAIWGSIDFEKAILDSGEQQRSLGMIFLIVGVSLLGTTLFGLLLHVQKVEEIGLLGFTIVFAGIYFIYSSNGVSVWSESITFNTTIVGISMMFYMLFSLSVITSYLSYTKKIGMITIFAIGIADAIFFVLPIVSNIFYYDTWMCWAIVQTIANIVMLGCLIKEMNTSELKEHRKYTALTLLLLLLSFEIDVIAIKLGAWEDGLASRYVFIGLFLISLIIVLNIIPKNINAATKAKELELQKSQLETEKNRMEVELKENRISLMLSQIRPHFVYNTLGTIERMCLKDPQKAFELVHNFSLYLRGNFSELDSVVPIRFSEEIKHVEYYVNIEKVRFPDMNIEYHLETDDFDLPALSVQPLVENAIKHGLMQLESGGTVNIRSFETKTHYCVEVSDNGAGFDATAPFENKKHVGLRNIRERLKAMVNGELYIESVLNVGTKAVIMIPKE